MDINPAGRIMMNKIIVLFLFFVAVIVADGTLLSGEEAVQHHPSASGLEGRKDAQGPVHRADLARKEKRSFAAAVALGEKLWFDRTLGANGMSCNICHPDAAATHPETFPKFKSQMGAVVSAQQFINWCIVIPLQGKEFHLGSSELTALEAYMVSQNRGEALEPGYPSP
ncbi:MAG: hypothetical protein HY202_00155 [Nitrospirae bacterium]|nr:hypothetical protein [Nitrospirota bacterium]